MSTTSTHQTGIVVDPTVPLVRIIRVASGMEQRVIEGYQRLDELLAAG